MSFSWSVLAEVWQLAQKGDAFVTAWGVPPG